MKEFKGRIVASGTVTAKALVSHGGLNTLASFQKALQFGDKKATCGDQNNPDLYGKQMAGKALCLPTTIGSTTGGLVLYCACSMNRQPACMLFSEPIDSLAAAGAILADVWLDNVQMPVIDSLGEEFLEYVKDDMNITVKEDGSSGIVQIALRTAFEGNFGSCLLFYGNFLWKKIIFLQPKIRYAYLMYVNTKYLARHPAG